MKIQDHYKNMIAEIERKLLTCGAVTAVKASLVDINMPSERTKIEILINTKDKEAVDHCLDLQDDLLDKYKDKLGLYFNMRYTGE